MKNKKNKFYKKGIILDISSEVIKNYDLELIGKDKEGNIMTLFYMTNLKQDKKYITIHKIK